MDQETVVSSGGDLAPDTEVASLDEEMLQTLKEIEARDPEPDVEAPKAPERTRQPDGKFAKTAETPVTPAAFQDHGPPTTWRAEAKGRWNELAPELKAEVYKREMDAVRGVQQSQAKAQVGETLWQTIAPYKPIMDALGADIPTGLNEVLRTAAIFHVGTPAQKVATLQALAQRHGIEIGQLGGNPPGDQFRDPTVEALNSRIANLEGQLANQGRQAQNSEVQAAHREITAFGSNPENKYFSDVAGIMGHLIGSGIATTMRDAYSKACNLHEGVSKAVALETQAKNEQESRQRAASARRAAPLGVRGVPTPRPVGTTTATSWQQGMEDVYKDIVARDAA